MPLASGITFETLLPLIGAIFVFSFGIFVWLKSPRTTISILFLGFCVAITYWLFGTFMMYLNVHDAPSAVYWDRFVYIGVVFVPTLMYHFSVAVTGTKGQRVPLVLAYAYSFVFLAISRTPYFVDGLNVFPRVLHSRAQIGHHVFLVLFYPIAFLMFLNLYRFYRKGVDARMRYVIVLTTAAFLNILFIGGTAYLPAYGIDIGYPFSYFSGIIFVILLSLAVARFEFISTRVLTAEIFTFLVVLFFIAEMLLSRSVGEGIFQFLTLVVTVFFGRMLISSTRAEVEQRERLQKLATQLADANIRLKKLDEAKSEFISIASHELRTPISVMKGYLSLVLENAYGTVEGALRDKVEHMYTMNERLVQLVNNMLNVSRIERRKIQYVCAPVDVRAVVHRVAEDMGLKARQKNLALELVDPPKGPVEAYVDEEKFHEIVINLVDNAIKYSRKGTIRLRIDPRPGEKAVAVTVADEGIGMTDEEARHIFRKFYRAKDPNVAKETGTGLGLFICAKFLRGMGGSVRVVSTAPDKGTTVEVLLPTEAGGHCAPGPKRDGI